jgi:tetratricopeptide (TPR) repeat protein
VEADALATWGLLPQLSYADKIVALRRAVALAEDAGLLTIAQRAHNNLAVIVDLHGNDHLLSVAGYRRASQLARQRGSVVDEHFFLQNLISGSCVAGDLAGAREAVERVRRLAQAQPSSARLRSQWQNNDAHRLRFEGSLEQALQMWQAGRAAVDASDDPQNIGWHYWHMGWVLFELGDYEQAEAALARSIETDPQPNGPGIGLYGRAWLVRVYAAQGRAAEAEALLREAVEIAGADPPSGAVNVLQVARAALALSRSDWASALADLQANQLHHRQGGRRWLASDTSAQLADVYLRRNGPGDRGRAREALAEAQSAFKQMGADGYVARLQARLDALGDD